ncbi:Glycosyltransferase involved in cell wall bisynthesis [Rhizobiales bacterium GAS188]|nr:Glycosyltransferase involved in cell wall bisynthesis [Rhizobiales bacterium GAS188]
MRIAYFSPLPPKHTGIATYSRHLAQALSAHAQIEFFDPQPGETGALDYAARPELLLSLHWYDALLYHFGNNPRHHLDMYRAFLLRPGVVVLHDIILYYLMAGLGRGGLLQEFLFNYGPLRLGEFFELERDCQNGDVLRYRQPQRYPLVKRILTVASGIIVHSETSARLVRSQGARCPVQVVPLLAYPPMLEPGAPTTRAQCRSELGIEPDELIIGCFGYNGPTKRLPIVFEAVARLRERLPCRVLVVGEADALNRDIAASGIADRVIRAGFVDDERFGALLRSIDILANLRFPSMGETSATLIQALACGIPSLVSNDAWFAELPDEAVRKIGVGPNEAAEVAAALLELGLDPARRAVIAEAGRAYVAEHCAPAAVARRYAEILAETARLEQIRRRRLGLEGLAQALPPAVPLGQASPTGALTQAAKSQADGPRSGLADERGAPLADDR